ncbi:ATP-dependent helicase [Denitrobaculum tricleocarpae]|uniref:DNA 3'-5' helicase n=1 Tax=Denitrobaculum tricleocarpae TaxID=2591009 RepID=A0A545T0R4_9PROT|nr:UvrD-helicase domain-containing protein [Denitrobaculum tricleocarpae]TQV70817.1 AAA family ATPase [Denitrobaculum tricleocarpae]
MIETDSASAPSATALADPNPRYPYLDGLNEAQREAVETLEGAVLMLAGAGTGKTRALTTRLAHLLNTGTAFPGQILAVTFTNRAAQEMKERVAALVGQPVDAWWLGTFHSIAAKMLRINAERVGLQPNFSILDTDDQLRLIKQLLQAAGIDDKKSPARTVLAVIQRWKDRGLLPDKVSGGEAGDLANGRLVELYKDYQERLRTLNACDFGDLLLHCLTLFQNHPDVLAGYHQRFKFILVDEYQDTNVAQYLWLRLLAQGHKNLCCVGDDDQSIYGWRGAEVGNILKFEQDFPGAKVIRLERNYRSTGNILGAASSLIAHNEGRLGKTLWTDDDDGELLRVRGLWDGEAEARFVGEEIEDAQRRGQNLSQIAILVRTGAQTREFEERFITLGLPYRVIGGPRFYERMEIRDALAYLKLLIVPEHDLAFERIVNTPKRGLGDATLRVLHEIGRHNEIPLSKAARMVVGTDELRPAARRSLGNLLSDFERWRVMLDDLPHHEVAEIVLDESGYTQLWMNDKSPEAPGRLENLKELVNAIAEFENLPAFLEHVGLVMEALGSDSHEMVSIMTLHAAKGLEFDTVFLPGWEEGLFPNQRALDESGLRALEEERRLAYVGLTRARQRVIISFAANRRMHGSWASAIPSRFVEELPDERVERESDVGVYGGGQQMQSGYGGGFSENWGQKSLSPGMMRAQSFRSSSATTRTPGKASSAASSGGAKFARGERVFHQKFGYGTIAAVEGDRLSITFDVAGEKKVIASFIVPADQAG